MRARFAIAASVIILATAIITAGGPGEQYAAKPANDVPTFSKDVAPILYKNCATCHRPGEIAPMSLLTYAEARPWAKSIRDEVSDGTMPPWHADPKHGKFANDRSLTAADRDVLTRWANGGAPEGDPKDLPAAPKFVDGWQLGQPDTVLQLPVEYKVPADGFVEYEYFELPTNFTEDKWMEGLEVRAGNRAVVHHVDRVDAPPDARAPADRVPRRAGNGDPPRAVRRRGGARRDPKTRARREPVPAAAADRARQSADSRPATHPSGSIRVRRC